MSDGGFFNFNLPSPEEVDKAQMAMDSRVHQIYNWFNTADQESLEIFLEILGHIIGSGGSASMQAAYWKGLVTSKLDSNYSICPSCHKNHYAELGEAGNVGGPPSFEN